MRRALRAGILITVLASTALVLSATIGGPGFPALPSVGDISDGLGSSYLSTDGMLEAFGFIAWTLWIYIVAATVLRFLAVVANRYAFPGARGLTRISDTVTPAILRRILDLALGGALLVSAVGGPRAASAHHHVEPPAAVQSFNVEGNGHKVSADTGPEVAKPLDDTYLVRPGDSLWKIAERELGSGFQWREIYDLNAGKEQADGRRLREPRLIRPGWELLLPHSEAGECEELQQRVEGPTPSQTESPPREKGQAPESSTTRPAADPAQAEPSPTPENPPVIVERPIRVELPDGAAVPASFAAGVLAASVVGRLRRRRERKVGQRTPLPSPDPVAAAASRAGIDPSIDIIGPQSQAVIDAWRESTGEIPRFLVAWENPNGTSFLIDAVPDVLPEGVETSAHQRITFEPEGGHTKALVTGPLVPRLRRGPFTAADGVLVPIGFTDSGVLHVPLIGPELHVSGSESSSFVETLLAFAAMRLGEGSIESWGRDDPRIRERLEEMIFLVVSTAAPGRRWREVPREHAYTTHGRQIDVKEGQSWVEVAECGLANPDLLAASGLQVPPASGLAMGLGLDRLLMLRKGVDDIRLLRSKDPRVADQMQDLAPYRQVSSMPPIRRDLSIAVEEELTEEELGDRVRLSLGSAVDAVEAIEVLSETPYSELPPPARGRLGIKAGQKNVLLRVAIRSLDRTLTDDEGNRLRDRIYAALHEGSVKTWASESPPTRLPG